MLGTIGAEDQMQTTVISDAVNVASRLEGMTKTFDINVVVSGSVVAALPSDHPFKLRGLGSVTAKGKTESVEVFECYDTDPDELAELTRAEGQDRARAAGQRRSGDRRDRAVR